MTKSQIQEIDNYILSQFLPNNYIPGLGLAILHGNDTLAKVFGIADLELGEHARNNTLFSIGSISNVSFNCIGWINLLIGFILLIQRFDFVSQKGTGKQNLHLS